MARKGRRREQDHLARRAQAEGYQARSVYKLEAIDARYGLFAAAGRGAAVLDLGAAPGSWTQFAAQRGMEVTAVDLQAMQVAGATCLQADFTDEAVVADLAQRGPFALVLSDAAPATTGNRLVDTGRSEALVESAVTNLPRWLAGGGSCVFKIFQGGGEQELLKLLRSRFGKAALFRPKAVRSESFETYLVGIGYRPEADDG